jgi:hypothetical protein
MGHILEIVVNNSYILIYSYYWVISTVFFFFKGVNVCALITPSKALLEP